MGFRKKLCFFRFQKRPKKLFPADENVSKSRLFSELTGAGILPPRDMNSSEDSFFISITGAFPKSPPDSSDSPTPFPYTGTTPTAAALLLTAPIEISSAIIAKSSGSSAPPGIAIISILAETPA